MWKARKSNGEEFGSLSGAGESSKRRPTVWIWVERLLLVSGLALLAVYGLTRIESILSSRVALEKFATLNSAATVVQDGGENAYSSHDQDMDPSGADFSLWDGHRVQAYKESLAKQSNVPLGVLRISKIRLEVPLLEGTDDLTLNHAVGRIAGTARPGEQGNIGIAGHRDGFFRGLKDVRVGDGIELKTLEGTETYVVDQIKIVTPADVDILGPRSVPSLTLVTCYPFYFIGDAPQRYIVTASLTGETKNESGNSDSPSVISKTQFKKEKQ